jgi:uncharacterized phage protein gp47/JayE
VSCARGPDRTMGAGSRCSVCPRCRGVISRRQRRTNHSTIGAGATACSVQSKAGGANSPAGSRISTQRGPKGTPPSAFPQDTTGRSQGRLTLALRARTAFRLDPSVPAGDRRGLRPDAGASRRSPGAAGVGSGRADHARRRRGQRPRHGSGRAASGGAVRACGIPSR